MTRRIDRIFIHCSATKPSQDIDAATIRTWHKKQGWNDIGYHWVIKRDGTREKGRNESVVGAGVQGMNANSIHLCLIGGIAESNGRPENNFTPNQWIELESLVRELRNRYPDVLVNGHNEYSNKACPCFDVQEWFKRTIDISSLL